MVFLLELRIFCRSLEQTKYQVHRLLQGKISDRQTQIDAALSQNCIINYHISYGFKRFNCFSRANPLQLKDLTETVKKKTSVTHISHNIHLQPRWVSHNSEKKLIMIQKLRLKQDGSLKIRPQMYFYLNISTPQAFDLLI